MKVCPFCSHEEHAKDVTVQCPVCRCFPFPEELLEELPVYAVVTLNCTSCGKQSPVETMRGGYCVTCSTKQLAPTCGQCGASLPDGAISTLCPNCFVNRGLNAPPVIRAMEHFTCTGWETAHPCDIRKGTTFRFTDEPGVINLATSTMDVTPPYSVKVDEYRKHEQTKEGAVK